LVSLVAVPIPELRQACAEMPVLIIYVSVASGVKIYQLLALSGIDIYLQSSGCNYEFHQLARNYFELFLTYGHEG